MREKVCRTYSEQVRAPASFQTERVQGRAQHGRPGGAQLGQGEHPTADEIVHIPTPPACTIRCAAVWGYPPTAGGRTPSAYTDTSDGITWIARCNLSVPQHGPHLPGAVLSIPSDGLHIDKAPPDAPGEAPCWPWATRRMTMRKSPAFSKDRMGTAIELAVPRGFSATSAPGSDDPYLPTRLCGISSDALHKGGMAAVQISIGTIPAPGVTRPSWCAHPAEVERVAQSVWVMGQTCMVRSC